MPDFGPVPEGDEVDSSPPWPAVTPSGYAFC